MIESDSNSSSQGKTLSLRWTAFADSSIGRATIKFGRWFLTGAIVLFLLYRLTKIGWSEVIQQLPSNPLFYFFLLCSYVTLPIMESIMYSKIWSISPRSLFYPMVKKKIYNQEVLGYSGELYLYAWAKSKINESKKNILHAIKDNIIISSITSTIVAFSLLGFYLYAGNISLNSLLGDRVGGFLIFSLLCLVVLVALLVFFRKSLLFLSRRLVKILFGLHTSRLILTQIFLVLQWNSVLPEVALSIWFTYLAVVIIISRVPFMPSKDLVFMGAGIELSSIMEIPEAQIAGMLLVASVVEKIINASMFAFISYSDRQKGDAVFSIDEVEKGEYFEEANVLLGNNKIDGTEGIEDIES